MSRVSVLINRVRDSLADPASERWTDTRLLSLIDEGQKDIARHTRLLKGYHTLQLVENVSVYTLPDDAWLITRATSDNVVIPFYSHYDMDLIDKTWFSRKGSKIEAIVYDQRNMNKIKIYPVPDSNITGLSRDTVNDGYLEQSVIDTNISKADVRKAAEIFPDGTITQDEIYRALLPLVRPVSRHESHLGVVTEVDDTNTEEPYGVLTDLASSRFTSLYGVTTDVKDYTTSVELLYIKDAPTLTSIGSELVVPIIFDTALKNYAIAKAYEDDLDTSYQQRSSSSMSMYVQDLLSIGKQTNLTDGTRAAQYKTMYRSAF